MFSNTSFQTKKPYLIVAGGTGGHISPGIALAESLIKAGERPVILSLEKNRGYPDFKNSDIEIHYYNAPPVSLTFPGVFIFPFRFLRSMGKAIDLIRSLKPVSVVGMGGFSVFPALVAALLFKKPVYLCEQNAIPGKATVLFSRRARRIFQSLPFESEKLKGRVKDDELILTGNPVRDKIVRASYRSKKRAKKLENASATQQTELSDQETENGDSDLFTELTRKSEIKNPLRILVLGGSQGAVQLNEMVLAAAPRLDGIVWALQCGINNLVSVQAKIASAYLEDIIHPFGYHTSIYELYEKADIILCRSGAGVVTEAALFGLPMILVPYPFAADNHQAGNAVVFEKAGAAKVIHGRSSEPESLISIIEEMQKDKDMLSAMHNSALSMSRPDAAKELVHILTGDVSLYWKEMGE